MAHDHLDHKYRGVEADDGPEDALIARVHPVKDRYATGAAAGVTRAAACRRGSLGGRSFGKFQGRRGAAVPPDEQHSSAMLLHPSSTSTKAAPASGSRSSTERETRPTTHSASRA